MKGRNIKILLNSTAIAASVGCEVTLASSLVSYTPIPGTADDDGWAHYKYGALSWNISNNGFYTQDFSCIDTLVTSGENVAVEVSLSDSLSLAGDATITEVSLAGDIGSLAKTSIKIKCNDFPTIETTSV